jgi:hypothetical protein
VPAAASMPSAELVLRTAQQNLAVSGATANACFEKNLARLRMHVTRVENSCVSNQEANL